MTAPTLKVDHIAWIDLEATGGDEHVDKVLEVGLILTEAQAPFKELLSGEWVLWYPNLPELRKAADPVVQRMHDDNGLWDACARSPLTPAAADRWIADKIVEVTGSTKHVALGGSGVAHYDRRFIRAQLPRLDKRLTYWALDTGVFRRMMLMAGRPDLIPTVGVSADDPYKPHRGLADIRLHLDEARHYAALLDELAVVT